MASLPNLVAADLRAAIVLKVPPAIRGECLDEYIVQWPLGDRPLPFEYLGGTLSFWDNGLAMERDYSLIGRVL